MTDDDGDADFPFMISRVMLVANLQRRAKSAFLPLTSAHHRSLQHTANGLNKEIPLFAGNLGTLRLATNMVLKVSASESSTP